MNSKSLPVLTYRVYNFWIDLLHYLGLEFGDKTSTQSLAYHFPLLIPLVGCMEICPSIGKNQLPWALSSGLIIEMQIPALPFTDYDPGKSVSFLSLFLHLQNRDYVPYLLPLVARIK